MDNDEPVLKGRWWWSSFPEDHYDEDTRRTLDERTGGIPFPNFAFNKLLAQRVKNALNWQEDPIYTNRAQQRIVRDWLACIMAYSVCDPVPLTRDEFNFVVASMVGALGKADEDASELPSPAPPRHGSESAPRPRGWRRFFSFS